MFKKISLCSLTVLLSCLFFFTCKTTMYIRTATLTPAEIDMSKYRKIAILSTADYNGSIGKNGYVRFNGSGSFNVSSYSYGPIGSSIASYFNNSFIEKIQSSRYFSDVITPPGSDMLANPMAGSSLGLNSADLIAARGVKAFVSTSIKNMGVDEYVSSYPVYRNVRVQKADGKYTYVREFDHYSYTLYQTANIEVELKIVDALTYSVIGTKTLRDSKEVSSDITYGTLYTSSMETYFRQMVENMVDQVVNEIIPHYVYIKRPAMDNKPSLAEAKIAYDYLSNGQTESAYVAFRDAWDKTGHVPSGYNAALLLQGQGKIDKAYDLMKSVYDTSVSNPVYQSRATEVYKALVDMSVSKNTTDNAKKQF